MRNKKERSSVNVFSDYALDERQKAIMTQVGFKSFRLSFYLSAALVIIWLLIYCLFPEAEIHYSFAALSFWIAAVVGMCYYEITASRHGILNPITSFSATTGGLVSIILFSIALVAYIYIKFIKDKNFEQFNIVMVLLLATAIINQSVMYFCGKRNFKVLDKQNEEE